MVETYKTKEAQIQKAKDFKKELSDLLKKYEMSIEAEDKWEGYSECGEDIQISFESASIFYEEAYEILIDMGSSIDPSDLTK